MKACLVIAGLLAVVSITAHAEWTFTYSQNGTNTYFDRDNYKKRNNKIQVWYMDDYVAPKPYSMAKSAAHKVEYDCLEETQRNLSDLFYYDEHFARGPTNMNFRLYRTVEPVAPNTIEYSLLTQWCQMPDR